MLDILLPVAMNYYVQATDETTTDETMEPKELFSSVGFIAYSVVIGIVAFGFSWSCNTQRNIFWPMKLLYGLFAALFGSLYLISYFFMTAGYCCDPRAKINSLQKPTTL